MPDDDVMSNAELDEVEKFTDKLLAKIPHWLTLGVGSEDVKRCEMELKRIKHLVTVYRATDDLLLLEYLEAGINGSCAMASYYSQLAAEAVMRAMNFGGSLN